MGEIFWIIVAGVTAVLAGMFLCLVWRMGFVRHGIWFSRRSLFGTVWRRQRFAEACRDFHWQREHLEARFVHLSQIQAKPDSPRPADCDFSDDVAYVRNRSTGELSAFVAVSIMLELPTDKQVGEHGGEIREATAVFRFAHDRWETDGRAIFNLSPLETIHFFQQDLEMVGQELAGR